jgi:rod shape-determining protein MreC
MHNLIAFFRRFRIFMLFALLQIYALTNYFTYLNFPRSQWLTSSSVVASAFLNVRNSVTKHWALTENNIALQEENVRLRKKISPSFIRLDNQLVKIDDSLYLQQYDYVPGIIINSSCNKRNNFFTINIGEKQGIKRGMGVFSDKGIVGVIHNTSDHFSVVKSVLTESVNVDVIIESSGAFGLLKWDGKDPRRGSISGISNDIKIKKGSKIVTRGGAGNFPRGLTVGHIETLKSVEGKPLWDVSFIFSENYRVVQNVYVVKNLLQQEQNKIEKEIPEDIQQ